MSFAEMLDTRTSVIDIVEQRRRQKLQIQKTRKKPQVQVEEGNNEPGSKLCNVSKTTHFQLLLWSRQSV